MRERHEMLDLLADATAAELEGLANHNPRNRRGVVAILDLLCSLDPEQMQNLLGQRLAESWHETFYAQEMPHGTD